MTRPFTSKRSQEPATLIRQEPGSRVNGRWVPGQETETDITVVSAPPDAAKMRDMLPEGTRLSESRMFWIEGVEIQPVRLGTDATEGDMVEYKGVRYRAHNVEDWGDFVEALGIREEGQ